MTSLWTITLKDLRLLLRDRRTFAIMLMLPLMFIMIIGMTTGRLLGWKSSNQLLRIAVLDSTDYDAIGDVEFLKSEDDPNPQPMSDFERSGERRVASHLVVDIVNQIQKTPGLEIRTVEDWEQQNGVSSQQDPEATARDMLAEGDVNAVLIFQPDFYQHVYHLRAENMVGDDDGKSSSFQDRFAKIGLEVDTRNPNSSTASAVSSVIGLCVMETLNPVVVCRSLNATIAERASQRYRRACGSVDAMANTEPDKLLEPILEKNTTGRNGIYDELVPSYTVMFVFFLVNIMARSFIGEREIGTLRRLRIAPVSQWSILLGKTLPFFLISLIQTTVLFGAGRLLFDMSWGSHPWMLIPIIITTSAAATGLGLLIATLVTSDAQVSAYATTTVIILAGISGCFMPRQWLPELMQTISLATPHAWALIAYNELLGGSVPNLDQVWRCAGMLALFAFGFLLVGAFRFRAAA